MQFNLILSHSFYMPPNITLQNLNLFYRSMNLFAWHSLLHPQGISLCRNILYQSPPGRTPLLCMQEVNSVWNSRPDFATLSCGRMGKRTKKILNSVTFARSSANLKSLVIQLVIYFRFHTVIGSLKAYIWIKSRWLLIRIVVLTSYWNVIMRW